MRLDDCAEQGFAYHVININDLERTLLDGIRYDDKNTYDSKYFYFHAYFDQYRPKKIPGWVERKKAIFASINFKEGHKWHSHSAVLKVKILMDRCWVCNENLANFIYEPFVLQNMKEFESAREYMSRYGRSFVEEYWENSLSYNTNLSLRKDKQEGYDAELLVMHHIPPEDIQCLYIVSDHRIMSYGEWQGFFRPGNPDIHFQYSRYLQPSSISELSKMPGLQ